MQIAIEQLDISRYEAQKIKPATLIPRKIGEVWLIRETPMETALSPTWSTASEGEYVRVPLFPYLVRGTEPSEVVAVAFKFGAQAGIDLYLAGEMITPLAMHISVGHPVVDLGSSLRFWLGFAFLVRR